MGHYGYGIILQKKKNKRGRAVKQHRKLFMFWPEIKAILCESGVHFIS